MAGKARRVASRQAQLSRKRRKPQKGATEPLSTVKVPADVDGKHAEIDAPRVEEPTPFSPAPAPVSAKPVAMPATAAEPTPGVRSPGRLRGERPATHNYIGAEMRRILLLAAGVMVIIVILGILL